MKKVLDIYKGIIECISSNKKKYSIASEKEIVEEVVQEAVIEEVNTEEKKEEN